jgi:2'-5' RNA ligase
MPRCFAAILLSAEARQAVAEEIERLRPLSRAVAWVPARNLHLTLRFLGEQAEERLPLILEALAEAGRDAAPFSLTLQGLGAFPGFEKPRILWVGVADGALEARGLQARVEAALEARGFGRESRPWHPHLTIGRIFDERRWRREAALDLRQAVARAGGLRLATLPVASLALMRSELSPAGARYSELGAVRLGGGPAS